MNFCFFAILAIINSFQISSLRTVSERDYRVTISDCTLTMSSDINDIVDSAREIVRNDYIKSKLPHLTNDLAKLIEKYDDSSLDAIERYMLINLTVLIVSKENL